MAATEAIRSRRPAQLARLSFPPRGFCVTPSFLPLRQFAGFLVIDRSTFASFFLGTGDLRQ
jgi:hypothetical protein